ncbi:MAG: hypothetical protein M1511_12000 [Deltaproteobacteria bacterium]|nr:hypothetical protein [Deltaproteobacteria bacterium]
MTRNELQEAFTRTLKEIKLIKRQIKDATDPREKRNLIRRKRELQYLQLWHINQLKNMD